MREAKARSMEMISSAEAKSKELRRVASEFVDDLMKKAEFSLNESLKSIKSAHTAFTSAGSSVKPVQQQPQRRPQQPQEQTAKQMKPEMINPKERS